MATVETILARMKTNQRNVRFLDCVKVCLHYFGEPRVRGSHYIFRTPWIGEPWVNIQEKNGYAKPYQVKQVLDAIGRLENEGNA